MASKDECEKYAAELNRRFDDLTRWAIANWPKNDFPLLPSDFAASRREMGEILGAKLGESDDQGMAPTDDRNDSQYIDMNPMPWP